MLRALSGLTTRGRCLLAAGIAAAVCSLVLNERDLLRVAIFVVALPLLVAAFISATRLRLGATRALRPERVAVGASGEVHLELWRSGRLPGGEVLLEDGVPYALGSKPRFVVERLPHDRRVLLRYPLCNGMKTGYTEAAGHCCARVSKGSRCIVVKSEMLGSVEPG